MKLFTRKSILKSQVADQIKHITAKNLGGKNQKKGHRYEEFFTLYKIGQSLSEHLKDKKNDAICEQLEHCFVDDLVIKKANKKYEFYQLKDVKKISWTKEIARDFANQAKYNRGEKIEHALILVISDSAKLDKLTNVPEDKFVNSTYIKLFPRPENCEDLVENYPEFNLWMKNISAKIQPSSTDLLNLAKAIKAEWSEINSSDFISVSDLILKLNRETTPIQTKWKNTAKWKAVKKILSEINSLEIYTERGIFEYKTVFANGSTQTGFYSGKLDRLFDKIIKSKPKTIEEFEELL